MAWADVAEGIRVHAPGRQDQTITRRSVLAIAACGGLVKAQPKPLQFGFSLYGMKTLPWREGLGHVARIGYQTTELSLRPGWNTEPKLLTRADRAEIRKRISDLGLSLASVMENLGLARPGASVQTNLERLRAAAEVCYRSKRSEDHTPELQSHYFI